MSENVTRVQGKLLSLEEVAERLQLPLASVRRKIWQHQWLPAIRIGRRVFIAENDLEDFIASSRTMPFGNNRS